MSLAETYLESAPHVVVVQFTLYVLMHRLLYSSVIPVTDCSTRAPITNFL